MSHLSAGLVVSPEHWAHMQADVQLKAPEEACGLVVGAGNLSMRVIPITNILHNPYAFRMDPQEELEAFYLAEQNGLDVLAIYHSHPNGLSKPSETDIEQLTFPGIIYLIWYKLVDNWHCRGYLMDDQRGIGEVPLVISPK